MKALNTNRNLWKSESRKPIEERFTWMLEKNQKEKRTEINFMGFIKVVCWKNSMK